MAQIQDIMYKKTRILRQIKVKVLHQIRNSLSLQRKSHKY